MHTYYDCNTDKGRIQIATQRLLEAGWTRPQVERAAEACWYSSDVADRLEELVLHAMDVPDHYTVGYDD